MISVRELLMFSKCGFYYFKVRTSKDFGIGIIVISGQRLLINSCCFTATKRYTDFQET